MTKLTETQTIILSAGAQRPENIALPLPKGLAGAAAKMAVSKMVEHGWLQEVDANLRRNEPLWRETGDGHGTTLVVTDAGLLAIGIEPVVVKAVVAIREHAAKTAAKPPTLRTGTKQAQIIALLERPEGATIAEIVATTAWQAHSARGLISGVLKKSWVWSSARPRKMAGGPFIGSADGESALCCPMIEISICWGECVDLRHAGQGQSLK